MLIFFYSFFSPFSAQTCTLSIACENLFHPYFNIKGADQPAQLRIQICSFVVRSLIHAMSLVSISEFGSLHLVCVTEQTVSSRICLETPKTGFLRAGLLLLVVCYFVIDQLANLYSVILR